MVFQICRRHRWHFVLFFKMLHLFFLSESIIIITLITLHISVTAVQVFQKLHCGHLHGPCQRATVFGVYCASYAVHDLHCTNSVFNCRLNFWGGNWIAVFSSFMLGTGQDFISHMLVIYCVNDSVIPWQSVNLHTETGFKDLNDPVNKLTSELL